MAGVYRWRGVVGGVQCTHPDDPARSYTISQRADGEWTCTCKGFEFSRSRGEGCCKHAKAYSLVNDRVRPLAAEPAPARRTVETFSKEEWTS